MILYKAEIRSIGSFASKLQGDTFFGAFCWNYKYLYGEEKLKELLGECMSGNVPIIFSNAFVSGYLPLPMGIKDAAIDMENIDRKSDRKQAYQKRKLYKKLAYIDRAAFRDIQRGNCHGYSENLAGSGITEHEAMHNMVDRSYGTVQAGDDGGNLFTSEEYFLEGKGIFDVYILSSIAKDTINEVLRLMLSLGIGADKSVGKGGFTLEAFEEEKELLDCENANAFVALSDFIPQREDPAEGFYKTFVKYGKLDREFAASGEPFKKPLLYIQNGSLFKTEQVREYYGRCLNDVAVNKDVVINACTIALPVYFRD